MRRKPPEISKNIIRVISRKPYGMSIEDISKELKINRSTASKYLMVLEATKKIIVRDIGKAKLHYPKTRRFESWLI